MASTYSQSAPLKADERALFEIFHQELLDPLVDLGRFARCLARLQRLSPLGLGGVTLDGGDPDAEGAGRLGFGHASLDGIHDLLAEVYGVGFHRSMMPPSPSSSQHAVTRGLAGPPSHPPGHRRALRLQTPFVLLSLRCGSPVGFSHSGACSGCIVWRTTETSSPPSRSRSVSSRSLAEKTASVFAASYLLL